MACRRATRRRPSVRRPSASSMLDRYQNWREQSSKCTQQQQVGNEKAGEALTRQGGSKVPWDHHAVGSPCRGITYCKWAWPETKLSQNTALLLCCVSPHSRAPIHPTPRSELCKVSLQVGQLSLLPAATLRACRTRGTRARAPPAEASPPPPPPTYLPSMPCRHLTRGPTYLPPRLIAGVDLPSMNKNATLAVPVKI